MCSPISDRKGKETFEGRLSCGTMLCFVDLFVCSLSLLVFEDMKLELGFRSRIIIRIFSRQKSTSSCALLSSFRSNF